MNKSSFCLHMKCTKQSNPRVPRHCDCVVYSAVLSWPPTEYATDITHHQILRPSTQQPKLAATTSRLRTTILTNTIFGRMLLQSLQQSNTINQALLPRHWCHMANKQLLKLATSIPLLSTTSISMWSVVSRHMNYKIHGLISPLSC